MMDGELDSARFATHSASRRGFRQAYVHEGRGGVPLLLVHGWPETKRIWWRNIAALADAGFEAIVPDLRGFGESEPGPDGLHDVVAHSRDLYALVHDHLGHERVVACGGDLGGPVIQDLSLRFPGFVDRMVLFNSPLPYDRERMAGMNTRAPREASDYFIRQGTDAEGLAAELATPEQRRRYIATFYTSRFWAHPGSFAPEAVDFMTEPFASARSLWASFGAYESAFKEGARSEPPMVATIRTNPTWTMILFGPSDHVLYPDFDRMAAVVFPDHVGPYLLRDCGHFVQWEAAAVLNNSLAAFCSDLLAAREWPEEEAGAAPEPSPLDEDTAGRVFTDELVHSVRRLAREFGYHPTRFMQLVGEVGAVNAARWFAADQEAQEGLSRLKELGAAHDSVEHMVLDPRFRALFSVEVRRIAHAKLHSLGVTPRWAAE
jgi:pimeloyl-ACP methyl ester carboxylesterase